LIRRIGLLASLFLVAMGPILGVVTYRVASRYERHKIATHKRKKKLRKNRHKKKK